MKKLLMAVFALVAVLGLAACGKTEATEPTDTNTTPVVAEVEYNLGMGIVVNANEAKKGTAQIDATVAAVVTDKDGKIVACRIDALQNKAIITDGVLESDNLISKADLKEGYHMAEYGKEMDWNGDGVVKEWYLQSEAFSKHVVGMTADEVKAMETTTLKNGYVISADKALLNAGCTIQITSIKAVVAESVNNAR